ncbi:cytochrome P450 [Actinoalloteichus hoggarensis]|uniref:Cytochrome P450 107B1 n=1 Tax=Actinoalloteichus hoggarensis TaxID=1470176 RepID=A0A221W7B5_9PSEU|nr:cytochrome P450 [Actinoalloteichus hoggarensis]ASO21257.1 Cytochrome P450 107B1 [Actinoalloteichus hoggarensis]MBB5921189.1 cytochrome P450 [Actinoalloteichus hoggarensis]
MTSPDTTDLQPPPGCPAHGGTHPGPPLYGADYAADPMRTLDALRGDGPISSVEIAPGVSASLVTDYRIALEVLRDSDTFRKDGRTWQATAPQDSPIIGMMMYRPNCYHADGPRHARLRGAITDSLDRIEPNTLRTHIERSADRLIDTFAGEGEADLLNQYAKILPLMVIQLLMGVPEEPGSRMIVAMTNVFDGVEPEKSNAELLGILLELIAAKRAEPGQDVTSWMLQHSAQLTDEEMIHQLVLLLGAGVEPTQNWIANALLLLLSDDRFAGDLAGGSMPVDDALVEVLWTTPPFSNFCMTYPTRDVEFNGFVLPRDKPVLISLTAVNTDPALASETRAGNRAHLAFGGGAHVCPAQSPARLITSVAIEKLLDRLPDLELAVPADQLTWRPGPFLRALTALPLRFPSVPVRSDETTGDSRWNDKPVPPSSTPPEPTSSPKQQASARSARPRWLNSLVGWWRGQ